MSKLVPFRFVVTREDGSQVVIFTPAFTEAGSDEMAADMWYMLQCDLAMWTANGYNVTVEKA